VITVNGIDATEQVDQIHLLEAAGESTLELLGRSGEPKPGRAVQVELKHRDFREPFTAMLQTDAQGRVGLGRLDGIVTVAAQPAGGAQRLWMLPAQRRVRPR
jgi:hypothetical protein